MLAIQAEKGEADEAIFKEWDDKVVRATTTAAASLDAEQASSGGSPKCQEVIGGSITQTRSEWVPTSPYDSPLLRVNTLGSDEGSVTLLELTVKNWRKKSFLSNQARRRAKIVVSDDEEDLEDSSKQGRMIEEINQDAGITLVTPTKDSSQEDQPEDQLGVLSAAKVLADAAKKNVNTYTRRRRAVSTGSGEVSTASSLFSTIKELVSTVVVKDKGKGIMTDSEDEQTKRTKLQQEQDRLGHEAAVRLQEELDEEERQRMARVHAAAQSFTEEEWENIRARVEADEELTQRLQAEERNKYSEVDQAKMLVELYDELHQAHGKSYTASIEKILF
ncbi:hypothetical protein Tco_0730150 [Tanacetum coccineum]|uniref:Uncharacterized protein n=1 Tax=Tanacetum coccineum TaxID=301880 RepID=A0ABQ4YQY8_9ASTR